MATTSRINFRSQAFAALHDALWIVPAIALAYWLRYDMQPLPKTDVQALALISTVAVPVQVVLFRVFGLYRGIWRFASIPDLVRIVQAVAVGAALTVFVTMLVNRLEGVPRSVIVLYPIILALGLALPRLFYRWIKEHHLGIRSAVGPRALIVGAGSGGELLVRDLLRRGEYCPVALVDDDPHKQGRELHGVRVKGRLGEIGSLIETHAIEMVLMAIPTAPLKARQAVVRQCQDAGVPCKTLPMLSELADGADLTTRLREVQIDDLLGREPVSLDHQRIDQFLTGRRVLVTGGGGSIGFELARQICHRTPDTVLVLDHSEFALFEAHRKLAEIAGSARLHALLGDVRDQRRMRDVFARYRPEVVFHAAAYKHVPLVEENPLEGASVNVLGSRLVADLAVEFGVNKFVLVSTDKAVNPTNLMGATKRVAEAYCQNHATAAQTQFITTRFGNVLGSRGSVVPLFQEQIRAGGPVTVTDRQITRYFMTIPEACQLILQAAAMGSGGEIFVLDMGEPVRIFELAEQMIRLAGYEPERDIEIVFTGLRRGEKLHEELFYDNETLVGTQHSQIRLAAASGLDADSVGGCVTAIEQAIRDSDSVGLRAAVRRIVPELPSEEGPAKVIVLPTKERIGEPI